MKTNPYSYQSPVATVPGTNFIYADGGTEFFPFEGLHLSLPLPGGSLDEDEQGRKLSVQSAQVITRRSGYVRVEPMAEGVAVASRGLLPRSGGAVRQLVTETAHGRVREGAEDYTLSMRVTKQELEHLCMSMESFFETEALKLLVQRGQPTAVSTLSALRRRNSARLRRYHGETE